MALLWRVVSQWTGGGIGTGFSNHYFTADTGTAQQASDAVRTFFRDAYSLTGAQLPSGVTITFQPQVDVIDSASGVLVTSLPVTPGGPLAGADSTPYGAPAGACVTWVTAGVVNGHRVRGRTFLVPVGGSGLAADGTLSLLMKTQAETAAAGLIASPPELVVWHRPASLGAGGGSSHVVLGAQVRDKVAILTSRR